MKNLVKEIASYIKSIRISEPQVQGATSRQALDRELIRVSHMDI